MRKHVPGCLSCPYILQGRGVSECATPPSPSYYHPVEECQDSAALSALQLDGPSNTTPYN